MVAHSRGFRNNNPGNIRPNPNYTWQGQIGSEGGYVKFDSMYNGFRALGIDLKNKVARGLDTIEKILPVYAPKADKNPTEDYINTVAKWSGVARDKSLGKAELYLVALAMARFELGPVSWPFITEGDKRAAAKSIGVI